MNIRYIGHFGEQTGFAIAAEENCRALARHKDVRLQIIPLNPDVRPPPDLADYVCRSAFKDDATIIHTLPMDLGRVDIEISGTAIAYTTWEATTCPPEVTGPIYSAFDQVWTPSSASRQALLEGRPSASHGRTHVIPHTFDPQRWQPRDETTHERVRFYWIGAWTSRKNPEGVIRAFCHAFDPQDDVELVMHSPKADQLTLATALARTGLEHHQMPRVKLYTDWIAPHQMDGFHRTCNVFVSASRGEAWNLPCFDALLNQRRIIATAGLGSDDYLYGTGARRISSRLDPASVTIAAVDQQGPRVAFTKLGAQGLSCAELWRDPDICDLARAMRDERMQVLYVGGTPRLDYNPAVRYGYDAVAQLMLERISS